MLGERANGFVEQPLHAPRGCRVSGGYITDDVRHIGARLGTPDQDAHGRPR